MGSGRGVRDFFWPPAGGTKFYFRRRKVQTSGPQTVNSEPSLVNYQILIQVRLSNCHCYLIKTWCKNNKKIMQIQLAFGVCAILVMTNQICYSIQPGSFIISYPDVLCRRPYGTVNYQLAGGT